MKDGNSVGEGEVIEDLLLDLVFRVVLGEGHPGEATEDTTGAEHTVNLREELVELSGVGSGLHVVTGIEGVVREGELVEVTLDGLAAVGEVVLGDPGVTASDLEVRDSDTGDVGAGELGNVHKGTADTAAEITDILARADSELAGKPVLLAEERGVEALTLVAGSKVEGLAPAVLVEAGGNGGVEALHNGGVVLLVVLVVHGVLAGVVDGANELIRRVVLALLPKLHHYTMWLLYFECSQSGCCGFAGLLLLPA